MPAEQPANATIEIFRNVRSYRQDFRHEAVKKLAQSLGRDPVMSVPGREVIVAQTTDGVVSDAWRFGHPVVTFPRHFVSLGTALASITDVKLMRLVGGRDFFLTKETGHNIDDLHAEIRVLDHPGANPDTSINPLV